MSLGGDGSGRFYCGRRLGKERIPGSDGQCGPNSGPQCEDCKTEIFPFDSMDDSKTANDDKVVDSKEGPPDIDGVDW